jgi:hypothetical protein
MCIRDSLFASSLSIGEDRDEIFIEGFHLIFPESKKTEPRKVAQEPASRQTKTFLWLDSLEEAATIVHHQKKPLTGTNVGKAFEKPVSAPAISDKLKNRQNTIRELFITHPDRWTLVKKEFKPLMNILTNQ